MWVAVRLSSHGQFTLFARDYVCVFGFGFFGDHDIKGNVGVNVHVLIALKCTFSWFLLHPI